jgi:hypothetical protein
MISKRTCESCANEINAGKPRRSTHWHPKGYAIVTISANDGDPNVLVEIWSLGRDADCVKMPNLKKAFLITAKTSVNYP